jgi:hypothetical protein
MEVPDGADQCRDDASQGAMSDDQNPTSQTAVVRRTQDQDQADIFDLDLYRLILRADSRVDLLKNESQFAAMWREIANELRAARWRVRSMMHPQDRAGTI